MEKPHILLVEDDLDLSEMVSTYFRVQNYEVVTAAWGEEALTIAADTDLDLILLDVSLPDMDGFTLCEKLLSQRKTKDIPIIFLTEKRGRGEKLQGLELGVVDYITKPFDIQELRLRVRNIITRSSQPNSINPVTSIAEGDTVEAKLQDLIKNKGDWSVLKLQIEQLDTFRERYGFVAADDVLRAVALMIVNAIKEFGNEDDFVGHLDTTSFIILSHKSEEIRDRIEKRVDQSRSYFYPLHERNNKRPTDADYIKLTSVIQKHTSSQHETVDELKKTLHSSVSAKS